MFTGIRARFTYANAVATLALVFAMSGGAYAANRYLITSTKQISPKVLKTLKGNNGNNGSNGSNGTPGAAGPAGPVGPTGPAGAGGPGGPTGPAGPAGPAGVRGVQGEKGTTGFTETLPSGKTETGVWEVAAPPGSFNGGLSEWASTSLSFAIPLNAALDKAHVHLIVAGEKGAGAGTCPTTSSVAKPEAEPGNLCVFTNTVKINVNNIEALNPETGEEAEAGAAGATLRVHPETKGSSVLASGSWAVTAP